MITYILIPSTGTESLDYFAVKKPAEKLPSVLPEHQVAKKDTPLYSQRQNPNFEDLASSIRRRFIPLTLEKPSTVDKITTFLSRYNPLPQRKRDLLEEEIRYAHGDEKKDLQATVAILREFTAIFSDLTLSLESSTHIQEIGSQIGALKLVREEGESEQVYQEKLEKHKAKRTELIEKQMEHLIEAATFNQKMASELYHLESPEHAAAKKSALFFLRLMQELKGLPLGNETLQALNAGRAQAALMLEFKKHGYTVLVPDVDDPDEVKLFDVQCKADFIAISQNGDMLCIDAKGRSADTSVEGQSSVLQSPSVSDTEYSSDQQQLVTQMKNQVIEYLITEGEKHGGDRSALPQKYTNAQTHGITVVLPTHADYLRNLTDIAESVSEQLWKKISAYSTPEKRD